MSVAIATTRVAPATHRSQRVSRYVRRSSGTISGSFRGMLDGGLKGIYGFLAGAWTILRNASMRSLRFGTGISNPFGVVCVGSSFAGSCALSAIHGEVTP